MVRLWDFVVAAAGVMVITAADPTHASADTPQVAAERWERYVVCGGTVSFDFDTNALKSVDLRFVANGQLEDAPNGHPTTFGIQGSSTLEIETVNGAVMGFGDGLLHTHGAFLVDPPFGREVIGNLAIGTDEDGVITVRNTLNTDGDGVELLELTSVLLDFARAAQELQFVGELSITDSWAEALNMPDAAGTVIGRVLVDAQMMASEPAGESACWVAEPSTDPTRSATSIGPDVIVAELQSVKRYGRELGVDLTAFAVGTTACNIGNERANWVEHTKEHPVILMDLYRLKDDRFEQIGMSWVKHGFYAVSHSLCDPCNDPTDGSELGTGCSDPYSASLNGEQINMSPRTLVNGFTGVNNYPWPGWQSLPEPDNDLERRMLVRDADLDPLFNSDARYFIEGHYILADDSAAGNSDNNASYREVAVSSSGPGDYSITINRSWHTQRGLAPLRAWQDVDPTVMETDIRIPNEGLFILGGKSTETQTGAWRYSYALMNLNSDRAARSFSIPLPDDAVLGNTGFHDIDYHSGETIDSTDWEVVRAGGAITWSTDTFEENQNANALRYDTTYNFYFETNVEPSTTVVTLGMFNPAGQVSALAMGPRLDLIDCNDNDSPDACDIDCDAFGCSEPCGGSVDCNLNGVPDDCEPDCNGNGIADSCDITNCPPGNLSCADCNGNIVPDMCEVDCDGDGIPDACDPPDDSDGDGVDDCNDLCPLTTPAGACLCPSLGWCCWQDGGWCLPNYPRNDCVAAGGVPDCIEAPCVQGCLLGDYNNDGSLDLNDTAAYQRCFSGDKEQPGYDPPPQECSISLDFDGDGDVDLEDVEMFLELSTGP